MDILYELSSNGANQSIRLNVTNMKELLNGFQGFQPAAVTNCQICLLDNQSKELECGTEILGLTPELLLKVTRFHFYEKAWECLKSLEPRLASVDDNPLWDEKDQVHITLSKCCQVVTMGKMPTVSMLDETVDYLQSLEDSIRCGQVTFEDALTDTNVNRERLATLLVAGVIASAKSQAHMDILSELIQVVVPNFRMDELNVKDSLYDGLEKMIGYVNSVCD